MFLQALHKGIGRPCFEGPGIFGHKRKLKENFLPMDSYKSLIDFTRFRLQTLMNKLMKEVTSMLDINFEDDQILSLNHRKSLIYLRILGLQFQTAAEGKFDISSDEINFVLEESSGPGEEMKKKYEKTKDLKITEIIFKQNSLNILIQRIDRLSLQALNVSEVSFIYLCRYFNVYIPRPACIKI